MRRHILPVVLVLLALGAAGCWPFGTRSAQPERGAMGLPPPLEERFGKPGLDDIEAQLARPHLGLRLVVRTDKEAYGLEEPIVATVRLENVSGSDEKEKARDLSVYFEPFAKAQGGEVAEWHFKFSLRSARDERVAYQSPRFEVDKKALANYYHYVTLPPKAFVGREFVFPPARARNWLEPGTYSLVVFYEVSEDFPYLIIDRRLTTEQVKALGTDIAYTRLWTGKLQSNRVEFRVRRRRFLGIF